MSQDPAEDPVERMDEMDHADQFPFLGLPNELISKTLSYASMKDRMAVRGVCKRLNAIEAETKYYVEKLRICDENDSRRGDEEAQYIICDSSFSPEFMRFLDRVSNNASVGVLYIGISLRHGVPSQIASDIYNTIKKFDAKNVIFTDRSMTDVLPQRYLIDIAAKCTFLFLGDQVPDSAELHEVYKGMVEGSMRLRHLSLTTFDPSAYASFLDLIGIRFESDQFFSNRDIAVYVQDQYRDLYYIFDGDLIIELWRLVALFEMTRHETPESLEDAKNAVRNKEFMVRLIVAPM